MDQRELKKLVQLMNDNGLVELEIEREGVRVHLRKAGALPVGAEGNAPVSTAAAAVPMPGAAQAGQAGAADGAADETPDPSLREIRSPMVGTFYRRPSPDADPYVKKGDAVDEETVVCIVEAMKVNNEIKAELEGEVVEILVEDGHPVEYDQPLFRVRA